MYTNFQLCFVVIRIGSANCLGLGHGHECHSPVPRTASLHAKNLQTEIC